MRHVLFATLLVITAIGSPSRASLPAGVSGSWYNPSQSGHGISVVVHSLDQATVFWFVQDAAGNSLHLYVDGTIKGNTILGQAYVSRGMQFGKFDPTKNKVTRWGTVNVRFDSCAVAQLDYNADGPAGGASFGSGAISMGRLGLVQSLDCALPQAGVVPTGAYTGTYTRYSRVPSDQGTDPYGNANALIGAVDPDGQFWAAERWIQGPGNSFVASPPVIMGAIAAAGDGAVVKALALPADSYVPYQDSVSASLRPVLGVTFGAAGTVQSISGNTGLNGVNDLLQSVTLTPDAGTTLARNLNFGDLAGVHFRQQERVYLQLFTRTLDVAVDANGVVCISVSLPGTGQCDYSGQLHPSHAGYSFFNFSLQDQFFSNRPDRLPYVGRGWVLYDAGGVARRIVLVGSDGVHGLGFVADRP